MKIKHVLKWGVPIGIIIVIGLCRFNPVCAESYSRFCYPVISYILSSFSSLFRFSVGDCFIVTICFGWILYPFYAWKKKIKKWFIAANMLRFLMWIYIWFYLAWGINYFRLSFYERIGIKQVAYSASDFQYFVKKYINKLNQSYSDAGGLTVNWYLQPCNSSGFINSLPLSTVIEEGYQKLDARLGLTKLSSYLSPKWMLWSTGMSKVGVTGYIGPFFAEFNLNRNLLNIEYPFTYAHELAHRLGIAREAEANLYAYLVTIHSSLPEVRFSGYFSILGYVMSNARRLLPEEVYRKLLENIRQEIIELYNSHLIYWQEKYNPQIGKVQHKVYNAYLKGNKINSGTRNYTEIIELLMSMDASGIF